MGTAGRLEGHHQYTARGHCGRLVVRSGGNDQRPTALRRRRGRHFAIHLVLIGVRAILSWIRTEWRAAGNTEERLSIAFATAAGCILVPLGAYVLWLWVAGVENPISTAAYSWLGWAWIGLLLLLMAGYGIYGLRWHSGHWSEVPGIVGYRLRVFLRGYLEFLGGPVTFPIREWRIRRERVRERPSSLCPLPTRLSSALSCCSRRCRSASLLPTVFSRVFASSTSGPPTHGFGRAGPAH